ncbi:MAG: RNA polymerase factor sigma-54 [Anaerolineaceae bacterium]|nr:RNA polymerase factor sigma-54 [Anaerolineaceae bacterium]
MRFDTSMQIRLEQRMKLAPRMIQSMEILQLPLMALEQRIQQELVANPVLELQEPESEEQQEVAPETEPAEKPAEEERPLEIDDNGSAEEFERLQSMADQWDDYFDQEYIPKSRVSRGERDAKLDALQNTAAPGQGLQEMLLEQFSFFGTEETVRELGETIIRNLNDNGYLRVPLEDIVRDVRGGATIEQAEAAQALVQRLEPAGVGARDLQECLLIQLERGGDNHQELACRIVAGHLHDIENNRYPQVAKRLGVSIAAVKDAVNRIQHLNPKPGASITNEVVPHIIPDVEIVYDEKEDRYRVVIVDERTPRLYISQLYRKMLRRRDLDARTREFVTRNVRSARWLIEAIEQRKSTLARVVASIVKFQRPFLDSGPDHLQPLKMQQVADDVSLHVGTISRAVGDKYADTPWGIFALRRFFTGGTETSGGQTIAWDNVRTQLKAMIDAEDKKHPLSDEEIVARFRTEGIDLARRTVAKYRKILDIPSSRRRKQY